MTPENSFLVPCEEAFVKNADGPFQRGSIWGEPDIDIAAALIRPVAENPSEALAKGEFGRKTVMDQLRPQPLRQTIRSCFVPPRRCSTPEDFAAISPVHARSQSVCRRFCDHGVTIHLDRDPELGEVSHLESVPMTCTQLRRNY